MAQTASPCQQARSTAIACCGADLRPLRWVSTPTQGVITLARSAPVTTAMTPGAFLAIAVAIAAMRAWAWGERTKATCAMRGNVTSLTNWARPWVRRARFGRGNERTIYEFGRSSAERVGGESAVIFISRLARSWRRSGPCLRHRLHRIDDGLIAGAAAVVA